MAALRMLEELLPFPLRGIDVDNDGPFSMRPWSSSSKNINHPSFKLKDTIHEGAKLKRRHHPPRTPMQRLFAQDTLSDAQRLGLESLRHGYDPVVLLETIRRAQATLASLSAGHEQQEPERARGTVDPEQAGKEQRSLSRFLRNLQLLWNESQPKPEPKTKRRYTPRQRTLFAEHHGHIEQWLESEATLSAAEALRRLMALAPGLYHEGQQRSIERRVREWRAARTERLLGAMRSAEMVTATEEIADGVATSISGNI